MAVEKKKFALILVIAFVVLMMFFSGCSSKEVKAPTASGPAQQEVVVESVGSVKPAQPVFPKTISVDIRDFRFDPDEISVNRGDTVSWINADSAIHTVSIEGNIESPSLHKSDSWNHTFSQPGIYHYRCGVHPSMVGIVSVS